MKKYISILLLLCLFLVSCSEVAEESTTGGSAFESKVSEDGNASSSVSAEGDAEVVIFFSTDTEHGAYTLEECMAILYDLYEAAGIPKADIEVAFSNATEDEGINTDKVLSSSYFSIAYNVSAEGVETVDSAVIFVPTEKKDVVMELAKTKGMFRVDELTYDVQPAN